MTIKDWLVEFTKKLTDTEITSARLDCLILLEYITKWDRAYVLAHPDISLNATLLKKLNKLVDRRLKHEPIAYITGHKEFAGLDLLVTQDTLIPRPETEELIELFTQLKPKANWQILDVGTGSGAIALAIKNNWQSIAVSASDTSKKALKIAKLNAKNYNLQIKFSQTNLLKGSGKFNAILANLPYVDIGWQTSPETAYEPAQALFAPDMGTRLIDKLIVQAEAHLQPNGYLILEHDPRQTKHIKQFATKHNYKYVVSQPFATVLQIKS